MLNEPTPPDRQDSSKPDTIEVDSRRCVGHGKCYLLAPDMLQPFDDEGRATFIGDAIEVTDGARRRRAKLVIEGCPEHALSWASGADPAAGPALDLAPRLPIGGVRLQCPCGEMLHGGDEDELVSAATDHLRSVHPSMATIYTREQILSMAS